MMLQLALAGLRRRTSRSLLAAAGVAIGVAAVVAFLSVAEGLDRSARGLINLGGAEMGVFQAGVGDLTASTLPESLAERIERDPGMAEASPVSVLTQEIAGESLLVFGLEPGGFVIRRLVLTEGRRPRGDEALLGDGAAGQLGLNAGDAIQLDGRELQIAGTYHTGVPFEDQGLAVSLAIAQEGADRRGEATTNAVAVEPGVASSAVADRIEARYPGTIAIDEPGQATRADTNSPPRPQVHAGDRHTRARAGALTVVNTMVSAALERRAEFALLRAVGWSPALIGRLVVTEGLVLGAAGVAAGLAIGAIAGGLVADLLGVSAVVTPTTDAGVLALGLAVGLSMGALGALYPAWRVARLPPAEALA